MLEAASFAVAARAIFGPVGTWFRAIIGWTRHRLQVMFAVRKLALGAIRTATHLHIRYTKLCLVQLCVDVLALGRCRGQQAAASLGRIVCVVGARMFCVRLVGALFLGVRAGAEKLLARK